MSGPGFDVLSVTPASVFSRGDVGAPAHPGRRCPPATPGAHCTDRKTGRAGAQCLLSRRPPPKPSLSSEIPPTPLRLLMRVPYPPRPPGCPEHPETPPVAPAMQQHHAQDSRRGAWGPMQQGDPPTFRRGPWGRPSGPLSSGRGATCPCSRKTGVTGGGPGKWDWAGQQRRTGVTRKRTTEPGGGKRKQKQGQWEGPVGGEQGVHKKKGCGR